MTTFAKIRSKGGMSLDNNGQSKMKGAMTKFLNTNKTWINNH